MRGRWQVPAALDHRAGPGRPSYRPLVEGQLTRDAWACDGCGVVSRMPEVGAFPLPRGWTADDGRVTCLACIRASDRERSGKGARKGAGAAARRLENAEAIAEIRVELREHPDSMSKEALKEIAEVVGCGVQKVRVTRTEMQKRGELARRADVDTAAMCASA